MIAGEGVTIEGNGQPGTPYTISVGGEELCGQVGDCVCAMATAGMGVDCAPDSLSVLPSTDGGNLIVTGSDGRLYSGDTPGPPPPTPAVPVFNSTALPLPNATSAPLQADSENYDTDGMHTGSSTEIVCVTPGRYLFHSAVGFDPNGTGGRRTRFVLNGTNLAGAPTVQASAGPLATGVVNTRVITLAAGDAVHVEAQQNSGGFLAVTLAEFSAIWLSGA